MCTDDVDQAENSSSHDCQRRTMGSVHAQHSTRPSGDEECEFFSRLSPRFGEPWQAILDLGVQSQADGWRFPTVRISHWG